MAFIPIIIPAYSHTSGVSCFVSCYDGGYINISCCTECGTYESFGKWWIWFKINGNTRYFSEGFFTKEEADEELIKIIKQ